MSVFQLKLLIIKYFLINAIINIVDIIDKNIIVLSVSSCYNFLVKPYSAETMVTFCGLYLLLRSVIIIQWTISNPPTLGINRADGPIGRRTSGIPNRRTNEKRRSDTLFYTDHWCSPML